MKYQLSLSLENATISRYMIFAYILLSSIFSLKIFIWFFNSALKMEDLFANNAFFNIILQLNIYFLYWFTIFYT